MTTAARSRQATDQQDREHLSRCLSDLPFYARTHLKIRTKEADLSPFRFNDPQKIVHKKISKQLKETGRIRAIVLKARQEGISTYVAGRFFRKVHLWPNQRAMVLADEKDRSQGIFEFYERMYRNLIPEMDPGANSTQKGQVLHLKNDSKIVVETAMDSDAGAGSTIQLLHASEVARWPNAKETFISLAQAVPDNASEIFLESTAKGVGGFFYDTWMGAEQGENGYLPIFLPWWIMKEYSLEIDDELRDDILCSEDPDERFALDIGYEWEGKVWKLTPEQLAWRRKVGIPEKCAGDKRMFKQEYPATPREAFVATGDTFFDKDALEDFEKRSLGPIRRGYLKDNGKGSIVLQNDATSYLRIWELPKKDGLYVIGADTATGKMVGTGDPFDERSGRDFSCAEVFEVNTRRQVAQLHGRIVPEEFARQLYLLGYFYGHQTDTIRHPATLAVESNHRSGETVIKKLDRELGYPALYYSRQMNTRTNRITPKLGWLTSKITRPVMLDELSEAVREGTILIYSPDTIREMFTFVLDEDGKPGAQEGAHDDRVISLAITLQVAQTLDHRPSGGRLPEPEVYDSPTGAFDYGY